MTHRIFVEKRTPFDAEARALFHDLRESLGLDGLHSVRVLQRYEVEGLTTTEFTAAVAGILSEPQVDEVFQEWRPSSGETAFGVSYLPGQFDQRADSASQCIQILTGGERPAVDSARIFVLKGNLSQADVAAVKSFVINPVDSREVPVDSAGKAMPPEVPPDVEEITGFRTADPALMRERFSLAMSLADVEFCQRHFRESEDRDPTVTELRLLDTYWSDHCRHTTFLAEITEATFEDPEGPEAAAWRDYLALRERIGRTDRTICMMDIALAAMRELKATGELDNLEESQEINAASIIVPVTVTGRGQAGVPALEHTEEWLVMFKNETHNHPTEIEPFGGAATCIGGCIRDPLSGRAYVYQAMRVTGAADPLAPFSETLPGKLPQKRICQLAARGYSSYGNQIGLATGQVAEVYHPGYLAKRLEIGAVVAAAPRSQVVRGRPVPGDVILLLGGRTGRDGIGGATGSSKEHTETALENSAEVQKGDAPTERKIQRLFRDPAVASLIKVCNDFGAGGVSVAIGEIAPSLLVDLDRVPRKYEGLDGTELAISESQERMAVCLDPEHANAFIEAAARENLECVKVADVTDSGRLVMNWRGKTIVDLPRIFLDSNGVTQRAKAFVARGSLPSCSAIPGSQGISSLPAILGSLAHASQRGLGEHFDGSVGAATVLWPFGGERQLTPPDAMVAKLPVLSGETDACTHMAWGFDPHLSAESPFLGAVYAVTESVCKAVASGARLRDVRLTLQEYFPKLGDQPRRWGLPLASLLGAFHAQQRLRLAAIGGKDSMSGSFQDLDVPPTLVSFALAPGKASRALSPEFKSAGSAVSIITVPRDDKGLPEFEALTAIADALYGLNLQGLLRSLHHIGRCGIAAAIAKCCFGNHIGFEADEGTAEPPDFLCEAFFSFLIEHDPLSSDLLAAALPGCGRIGRTVHEPHLRLPDGVHLLADLREAWESVFEPVYPTRPPAEIVASPPLCVDAAPAPSAEKGSPRAARRAAPCSRPVVVIPAFPGTNSEYDSARAFSEAGAGPEILVFRNLDGAGIRDSLHDLAKAIRRAQILMLPGGFSAGDEPDGSAKFIATVLRNPRVSDAVMDLLRHRDGLILGICNGFQALIKTGLVPFGEIRPPEPDSPTLVHNDIGRHVSRYVRTRIESARSPWLSLCSPGETHIVPVSHGEGKFTATPAWIAQLASSGQIATRYCDGNGTPSMHPDFNPNGSLHSIEGITSPCGRVLGKMAHSERSGKAVACNIPGKKLQPIFEAGVRYWS